MEWVYLLIAGLLEIVWAVGLKYTDNFSKLTPSIVTVIAMFLSFWFLSIALKVLPLGTSYAIWTGIGTLGTVLFGIFWLGESINLMKIIFIMFILVGIIGLKTQLPT